MAYRFVKTGSYVDFYDGSMPVIKLHQTSRCVTWIFDNTPGLNFKIDEMIYHTDNVADISFDDVPCATQADFITGIIAMFPDLAGGEGGDGVTSMGAVGAGSVVGGSISGSSLSLHKATETQPGLISVDVTPQVFGGPKSFSGTAQFQNSAKFESIVNIRMFGPPSGSRPFVVQNGVVDYDLLHVDITPNSEHSVLASYNTAHVGESTYAYVETQTTDEHAQVDLHSEFKDGTKMVRIKGKATATTSEFEYIADTHIFEGDVVLDSDENIFAIGYEIAATFAAISASTKKRLIEVTADEENNGDMSLYRHNGTTLKFLQTIA